MSAELLDETARWAVREAAAPDDAELAAAVADWLDMRLRHRSDDYPSDGSFLRIVARDAAANITAGWGAERFRLEAALYELPGHLSWPKVKAEWLALTSASPGTDFATGAPYRRRKGWPSRPEFARTLNVSVPTLKRAMVKAGQGSRWPPPGLTT